MTEPLDVTDPGERALAFLRTRTNYEQLDRRGATFDLSPIKLLLERLCHPEKKLQCIHIAGTKGKGSTTWFVDAFLRRAGARTGRFISPHLQRLEERVAIDGQPIEGSQLYEAVLATEPFVEESKATFFDILTAAAILCFERRGVEFAVLETGLGGRLDSTNGIDVKISTAVTALGLEHTEVLGKTLVEIATEKAAIARRGVPLFSVTNPQTPQGRAIARTAAECGAPVLVLGREFSARHVRADEGGFLVDVETVRRVYTDIRLPGRARYQIENLALAVAMVDDLESRGIVHNARAALEGAPAGAGDLRVPGRFEVFGDAPPIILDGAHTSESLTLLFDSIDESFPGRPRVVVFGASRDKDLQRLFAAVAGRVDICIITRTKSPRAALPDEMDRAAKAAGMDHCISLSLDDALPAARTAAGATGLVVITGSLYLVGEARGRLAV
ncbi:MAG: hypothetical protein HY286_11765 [Planctomycetes bacterium]|nr:hypothetical protein [Planctomycetota bacterium]